MIAHVDARPWNHGPRAAGPSVPVLAWSMLRQQPVSRMLPVPAWVFGLATVAKIPPTALGASASSFAATCMWGSLVYISLLTPQVAGHYAHLPVHRTTIVRAIHLLWTALLLVPLAFRAIYAPDTLTAWGAATALLVGPGWTRRLPEDGDSDPRRRILLGAGLFLTLWAPDPVLAMTVGAVVGTPVGPWLDPPARPSTPTDATEGDDDHDTPAVRPDDRPGAMFWALLRRSIVYRAGPLLVGMFLARWLEPSWFVGLLAMGAMIPLRTLAVNGELYPTFGPRAHLPVALRPLLIEGWLDALISAGLFVVLACLVAPSPLYALCALGVVVPALAPFVDAERTLPMAGTPGRSGLRLFLLVALPYLSVVTLAMAALTDPFTPAGAVHAVVGLTAGTTFAVGFWRAARRIWTAARPPDPGLASTTHLR